MFCDVGPDPQRVKALQDLSMPTTAKNYNASEVGSTAVQKYRGTVTRYFFSTVTGNVDTFSKKYHFW